MLGVEKKHGFLPDEIKDEDYVFGASPVVAEPLVADGQWDVFLPLVELQNRNLLETYNCTAYGTLNCIEVLLARKYGGSYDFSERYVGVLAETSPQGNSPHKMAETIRKISGLIPEGLLPFNESINTWEKYYSPKPMDQKYLNLGLDWLERNEFKHEWVFLPQDKNKADLLVSALPMSPLGVSVLAWEQRADALYHNPDQKSDTHWVMLYGYKFGEYWKVFDSYDNSFKKLVWEFPFGFAKRYFVRKIESEPIPLKKHWWDFFIRWMRDILS